MILLFTMQNDGRAMTKKEGVVSFFAMPFTYKTIFLPRQARDKHRESTQNRGVISAPRDS
jgi:hypothetical protein